MQHFCPPAVIPFCILCPFCLLSPNLRSEDKETRGLKNTMWRPFSVSWTAQSEFQLCVAFCLVAAAERDQNIACLKASLLPDLITTRQKMDGCSIPAPAVHRRPQRNWKEDFWNDQSEDTRELVCNSVKTVISPFFRTNKVWFPPSSS